MSSNLTASARKSRSGLCRKAGFFSFLTTHTITHAPKGVPCLKKHPFSKFATFSSLAADVGKSAPPLDYDKDLKEIHLTDPFFRFYLKWGVERTWH
ncbi:hypothetical protein [Burkholderia pseudomallei]|uniref:hypothetical protein n=1 Tax=Burkholderia pseudomallei TaxID=28450 RepID=UPI0011C4D611|nr:hypothetical protein [Burkholderia pseudomallei]